MSQVLLFTSPQCTPCKQLKKDLESMGYLDQIDQVDVSMATSAPMMAMYGVRSVPTLIFLDDAEEIIRVRVGYTGDLRDLEGLFA